MESSLGNEEAAKKPGAKRWIAVAIAGFLAATVTAEVLFAAFNWEYYAGRGIATVEHFVYIALFGFLGPLVVYRRPENPIGWLLATAALLRQVSALSAVVDISIADGAEVSWVHVLIRGLWPSGFTFALLALAIVMFPSGALPSRSWRPVVWLVALMGIIDIAAFNLYPALDARRIMPRRTLRKHWSRLSTGVPLVSTATSATCLSSEWCRRLSSRCSWRSSPWRWPRRCIDIGTEPTTNASRSSG